ncbi:MAG TPA: dockerin type I domain-containing protein [Fimbriimonadaceae bacterium]|nr:dockerin type I domain-containing protein [Fimbriimonadaceae bacterium]
MLGVGNALAAGTWQPLAHQPSFNACAMQLLTDGSVFVQAYYQNSACWKLTPDANGSYVNGTWTQLASMHDWRLYYASSVLADGRVFVSGGEYSSGGSWTNHTEIYDPLANTWTTLPAPSGWANVGDAPCMVLANGTLMMGSDFDSRTAFFNPATNTWSAGPNKFDSSSDEETWQLLPDGTVLAIMAPNHPGSEKYVPAANAWVHCPNLPVDLVDAGSEELGGMSLLPNGTVFAMGATPHSAIYTPPANPGDPGSWATGPNPPSVSGKSLVAADAPLAQLPNGKVLLALAPLVSGGFGQPTYFAEYDGSTISTVPNPANNNAFVYNTRLLVLPTGQVMFTNSANQIYIYTPDGTYQQSWAPHITNVPSSLTPGSSYVMQGTQLNGISQGCSYGDDYWAATNYPIVRITNNASGHVFYCRTFNHSTMGVATGNTVVSTNFAVPSGIENGPSTIVCVANGIPSTPVNVTVGQSLVTGTITLQNYVGTMPQVTIEVRQHLSFNDIATYTITPNADGTFSIPAPTPGAYDFAFKASHWLKKSVGNITVTSSGATGVSPSLINGDVNGDNQVSLADFSLLNAAYGSTSSSGNWNANADLNGNGGVSLSDFAILRSNYGAIGDQ